MARYSRVMPEVALLAIMVTASGADIMLRYDGQSGSIPVQTVDAAEDKGQFCCCKIVCEGIRQGIVIIVHGRVDQHACRQ